MEATDHAGADALGRWWSAVSEAVPSEMQECIALVKWMRNANLIHIHIPNGMYRTEISGSLLKKMGVMTGFPDYLIFNPPPPPYENYRHVALEMKRRKGGAPSDNQLEWLKYLPTIGILGVIAEGAQNAVGFLSEVYAIPNAYPIPMQVELFR